jgi:hypothetical protein
MVMNVYPEQKFINLRKVKKTVNIKQDVAGLL